MADDQPPNDPADRPRASVPHLTAPDTDTDTGALGRRFSGAKHRGRATQRRLDVGRGVTTAAVVVATLVGAAAIGAVAGLLTLFGWGAAIVVAILVVGVVAAIRPLPANGWLLVPLLALAIPSAAVAISGARVLPQRGPVVEAPTTVAQIPDQGYRAGLGDLLVDLRDLDADDGDQIVIPAGSDLGRTIVALPQKRCFNLDVRWQTGDLRLPRVRERPTVTGLRPERPLSRLGRQSPGNRKRFGTAPGRIVLFGRAYTDTHGRWVAPASYDGAPTLTLELASEGGSFVVRDYPDRVSPLHSAGWPIDQKPPTSLVGRRGPSMADAIRREERAVLADRTRTDRAAVIQNLRAGGVRVTAEAHRRVYDRWRQQTEQHQEAFGRDWARRVTGTCNPRGTLQ